MSINCRIIEDLLPLFIDGLVSSETNKAIEEHLEQCSECRRVHKILKEDIKLHQILIPIDNSSGYNRVIKKIKCIIIGMVLITFIIGILMGAMAVMLKIKSEYQTENTYNKLIVSEQSSNYKDNCQ
jgi:hypothetical protein